MRKLSKKQLQAREVQLTKELLKTTGAEYYKLQRRVSNIRRMLFTPEPDGFVGAIIQLTLNVFAFVSACKQLKKSLEELSHAK